MTITQTIEKVFTTTMNGNQTVFGHCNLNVQIGHIKVRATLNEEDIRALQDWVIKRAAEFPDQPATEI